MSGAISIILPTIDGATERHVLQPASPFPRTHAPITARTIFAAAHVVADPRAMVDPWRRPAIDWEATLAFRRHLWGLGLKVAEAMDTAQRGMGLDWPCAAELIERSTAEARAIAGADLACGAGTDQLAPGQARSVDDVVAAYRQQLQHIEACGGRAIIMASRALCRVARSAEDYLRVYERVLSEVHDKVILHWLGEVFDPELAGYWGSRDLDTAMSTCLELINACAGKIDGIKISLLARAHEERMRRLLPRGVKIYTGDDFSYVDLIEGEEGSFSHGLLGIFGPIAAAVAPALDRLAAGDTAGYRAILAPTVPLARRMFETPTPYYKAGIVLLAWLNGFQDHFRMVGGLESARGILHYAELFRLADRARLLVDPERAAWRMKQLCAVNGVEQAG